MVRVHSTVESILAREINQPTSKTKTPCFPCPIFSSRESFRRGEQNAAVGYVSKVRRRESRADRTRIGRRNNSCARIGLNVKIQ